MESRLLDPSFAPLVQRNLSGIPSTLVVTCQFDILRDEGTVLFPKSREHFNPGVLYAQRLRQAKVPTTWKHYEYGFHAMLNFHNELYIAQESLKDIVEWTLKTIKTA